MPLKQISPGTICSEKERAKNLQSALKTNEEARSRTLLFNWFRISIGIRVALLNKNAPP